jgi:metallophosphoesterase (TIGR00282 family)
MIGDVVGDPGLQALEHRLPRLIRENSADFVVVNGENAAGGFGLTAPVLERIFAAGADVVSGGNHIFEQREFWPVLDNEKRILRPLNYPNPSTYKESAWNECPGRGWVNIEKPSPWGPVNWLAINLQGREFMTPIDCPFRTFDSLKASLDQAVILVDFHAESSREKEAMAYYLDGRVTALAGTHTHVQTADERLLPNGSAYISDLGMCGTQDGVIGMDTKICLDRARKQVLYRMEVAAAKDDNTAIQGIIVEINFETRKALSIRRFTQS